MTTLSPMPARRPLPIRLGPLAVAVAVVAGATACSDDGSTGSAPPSSVQTTGGRGTTSGSAPGTSGSTATPKVAGRVVGRFAEPIALVPRPGHADELWLAERAGRVRRVLRADDGTLTATGEPLLDLSGDTTTDAERGLLGMTFADDGRVLVVSHTDRDGNSRIAAYDVVGDRIDPGSRRVLLAQDQPFPNHNGGNVVVGPDGKLWSGFGDGGAADDPANRAQDPGTLLGKIVRFDLDGGKPEIVVSGLRNPWRFAFDTDGSLWIADVGQAHIEEIDHLAPDQIEGANLGWSGYEGDQPYLDGAGRRPADAVPPVFQYTHAEGGCSITGGVPYHGTAISGLDGAFVFADYCAGHVRAVVLDDRGAFARELDLGVDVASPISFAESADGEVYVLSAGGDVVQLVPRGS